MMTAHLMTAPQSLAVPSTSLSSINKCTCSLANHVTTGTDESAPGQAKIESVVVQCVCVCVCFK